MSFNLTPANVLRLMTDPSAAPGYRRYLKTTLAEALKNLEAELSKEDRQAFIETVASELGILLKADQVTAILSISPVSKGVIMANSMNDTEAREEALSSTCLYILGCYMPCQSDLDGSGFTRNQFVAQLQTQAQAMGFSLQTEGR